MYEFALNALDLAIQQGATYADVRVVQRRVRVSRSKMDRRISSPRSRIAAMACVFWSRGAWGFAASSDFGAEAMAAYGSAGPVHRQGQRPGPDRTTAPAVTPG